MTTPTTPKRLVSTIPQTKNAAGSLTSLILGYLSFNTLLLAVVCFSILLLVGLYQYPKIVGPLFVLPYYSYVLVLGQEELKEGMHWPYFSKHFFLYQCMRRFLSLKLVATPELTKLAAVAADKKESDCSQFLFAVFPHGTNADFRMLMDGMLDSILPIKAVNLTKTLAATVLFRIPVVRELALWTGCVDARRSVAERHLSGGKSIIVLPGGQEEQLQTVYGKEIVYLLRRKGFVKLAIKHNVPLVPVYVFGVSDYYKTSSFLFNLRLWLVKNMGIAIPLYRGFWGSLACPMPVPTTIVFGKPMLFTAKDAKSPTDDEVDAAHKLFVEALVQLFDTHKADLGYGDRKLEVY